MSSSQTPTHIADSPPQAMTCLLIMQDAYFDAGLIGEGDELNSEQITVGMRRLNKYCNYLQTKGLKLFVEEDYSLQAPILQTGVSRYEFGPVQPRSQQGWIQITKPRRVIEGYAIDQMSQARRPILPLSRNEWDFLSTTTQPGTINNYYVDKRLINMVVNLWLTPDDYAAGGQIHLILDLQIGNFAQVTDTMAFPAEWGLTLEWGLAHQLCTGQPPAIVERCTQNMQFYQEELENWDVEDASTKFEPDQRGQFVGRRFS